MLDPLHLAALAAVHRRGSFEVAAAMLGLTQSAVSQRIRALEERVGAMVIRRGSPSVATEAGLRLIRHFEEVSLMERALAEALPGIGADPVTLRIAVNADSLATWVIPALAQVPGFLFDLVIDDQDFSQDWLRRGEVAAAVTAHAGPLQGCDTISLGRLRYRATASPAYMARWFGDGVTSGALLRAPALTFSDKDALQGDWIASQGLGVRAGFPSHRLASTHGFVDACLQGLGWGMNPEPLVTSHLASGRLVELISGAAHDVPLYWQYARLTAGALEPLTRAVRRAAASVLLSPLI